MCGGEGVHVGGDALAMANVSMVVWECAGARESMWEEMSMVVGEPRLV